MKQKKSQKTGGKTRFGKQPVVMFVKEKSNEAKIKIKESQGGAKTRS